MIRSNRFAPPPQIRRRPRKGLVATVERLSETLEARLGHRPTDEEMARMLAISIDAIRRARSGGGK